MGCGNIQYMFIEIYVNKMTESKKKQIVVFGTNQFADLANYYLTHTTNSVEIVAFTVHSKFIKSDTYNDKPLVAFENLRKLYPPTKFTLFAPMSGKGLNKIREYVYNEGKNMGYKFYSYISPYATVLTTHIGENCFILEDNTIQPFVEIGNNCVLWSGNHIGHHTKIKDHVFITSHVVISGNCVIESYSWFGVNSTMRDNIKVAKGSLISMSACVVKDTQEYTIYMGVPAKEKGSSSIEAVANSL